MRKLISLWNTTLVTRLTVFSLIVALVPAVLIGLTAFYQAQQSLQNQFGDSTRQTAEVIGASIQRSLEERRADLQVFARLNLIANPAVSEESKQDFLRSALTAYANVFSSFYITDMGGNILASTDNSIGSFLNQPWFAGAIASEETTITDIYYLPTAQSFVITVTSPLNYNGIPLGLLIGNIEVDYFSNIVAGAQISGNGDFEIINRSGTLVIDRDVRTIFEDRRNLQSVQQALNGQSGSLIEVNPDTGQEVFYTFVPLEQNGWIAVATIPLEELNAPVTQLAERIALITAGALVIVTVVVVLWARVMVAPIRQLTKSAQRLSSGDFNVDSIQIQSQDEIGKLADTFRYMASELNGLIDSLETRVEQRTRDLEIASDVSRQITTILDLNTLLSQVVERTASGFQLYFVSIFRFYPETEQLIMRAGVSEKGQEMLALGKQFKLKEQGLVPLAARSLNPVVINKVTESSSYSQNPLLPLTRAEVAIPMIIGTDLIGVLDLQAIEENRFSEEDVRIFKTLAEQIAIAIRNAELYENMQSARKEAERANSVKSAFLASVSHELRTPLNSIINFTKFVIKGKMGPTSPQQESTLKMVADSGEHLLRLINDVLDISKIESGSLQLYIEDKIHIEKILANAVESVKPMLSSKPVTIINQAVDLPVIQGDYQRIYQIFLNILSNACKFTKEGQIVINTTRNADELIISITDSGPGIAAEEHELVFESFRQTQSGLREGGGTGLGMPISRRLAEAHGGRLWVESEVGQGATFFIALPFEQKKTVIHHSV